MPRRTNPDALPIAAYVRVSHKDQKLDSQRMVIERWIASAGLDANKVAWYEDTESGRKMSRAAFDKLIQDINLCVVNTVIVYKIDRIARRLREGLNVLCDWADRGVRVVSVTQQVDVSGTVGRMVAALLLGLAEIEWEYRKERQQAGIAAAKARGVTFGRPKGTGRPISVTDELKNHVRKLRGDGMRPAAIARLCKISRTTVYEIMS